MKKYVIGILLFLILAQAVSAAEELRLAPDFKLADAYNKEYSLSSYKEKQPVILLFWATWCPFCRKELSGLKDRYPQLVKQGFELFAVDVGESESKVDKFAKANSLNFKILLDKDTRVAESYDVLGIPTYILIDKAGHIISVDHSFPEEQYKELIKK